MITIIEIPHQKPALAWCANDYKTACDLCAALYPDRQVEGLDKDALYEWLDDNHQTIVLADSQDWKAFFTDHAPNHQRLKAQAEARKIIRYMGQGFLKQEMSPKKSAAKLQRRTET